jgi:hypothetical protein
MALQRDAAAAVLATRSDDQRTGNQPTSFPTEDFIFGIAPGHHRPPSPACISTLKSEDLPCR